MSAILQAARSAYAAGLAPIPTENTGSKAPDVRRWKGYQATRPTVEEMRAFDFTHHDGLGIVAGPGSGYRECWDFDTDDVYRAFVDCARAAGLGALIDRLTAGYLDRTPGGGRRIIVTYPSTLEFKDVTLARRPGRAGEPPIKTLIELPTFAIVAPSNGRTHPSGKAYERLAGGFDTIASYTLDERAALIALARMFDEMPRLEAAPPSRAPASEGTRPGDAYNQRIQWSALLEAHGWTFVCDRGDATYWRRPGKATGISATTNYGGSDLLYVFSSSTPFDPEKSYSKFGAYTVLVHGGDYARAASVLLRDGYGAEPSADPLDQPARPVSSPSTAAATGRRIVRLTRASDIAVEPVTWLWEGRLPVGVFALVGGREGIGKSILTYSLTAGITMGTLPGTYANLPKSVIICATEDSWAHTITPRLMAAGADLTKVYRADVIDADGFESALSVPADVVALTQRVHDVDAALVILDPLLSRLDARLDSHKDADTRRALEPLAALADTAKVTVLGLIHVNKSASTDALTLLMASRAFTAVARSVLFVAVDPDDEQQRLLSVPKNNLGRTDLPMLLFKIHGVLVAQSAAGADVWTGQLTWTGESEQSIRDVLERVGERDGDRMASREAAEWLVDFLTDQGGTVAAKIILDRGRDVGHSRATLYRARQQANIQAEGRGYPRSSYWLLPPSSRTVAVPVIDEVQTSQTSQRSHVSSPETPETSGETSEAHQMSHQTSQVSQPLRRETPETSETSEPQPFTESDRRWRQADEAFKKGWEPGS